MRKENIDMKTYSRLTQSIVQSWLETLSLGSRQYKNMLHDFNEVEESSRKKFIQWLNIQDVKTITQFIFVVEE